jgi:hypothetical protein
MKKNRILAFLALSLLGFSACQSENGDGNAAAIDTNMVVKEFLVKNGVVEENAFFKEANENQLKNTKASAKGIVTANMILYALGGPEWMSSGGLVSTADAQRQIDTYLDLWPRHSLRSFTINRKVFEDYITKFPADLEEFKLCIGVGKTAAGGLDRWSRSLFVLGISKDGFLLTLPDATGAACYYNQISPCPSDCPKDKGKGGRSHCDYLDPTKCLF